MLRLLVRWMSVINRMPIVQGFASCEGRRPRDEMRTFPESSSNQRKQRIMVRFYPSFHSVAIQSYNSLAITGSIEISFQAAPAPSIVAPRQRGPDRPELTTQNTFVRLNTINESLTPLFDSQKQERHVPLTGSVNQQSEAIAHKITNQSSTAFANDIESSS